MKESSNMSSEISFLQKIGLIAIAVLFLILVCGHWYYVTYSIIELGRIPRSGIIGTIITALFAYLYCKFDSYILKSSSILGVFVIPVLFYFVYSFAYNKFVDKKYDDLMRNEKNLITGVVYRKRVPMGRGVSHGIVDVGYNKYKFSVPVSKYIYNKTNVRDTVILLVPKNYPSVMSVIKWNPTNEEKLRYKVPRKFRALINLHLYDWDE